MAICPMEQNMTEKGRGIQEMGRKVVISYMVGRETASRRALRSEMTWHPKLQGGAVA